MKTKKLDLHIHFCKSKYMQGQVLILIELILIFAISINTHVQTILYEPMVCQ